MTDDGADRAAGKTAADPRIGIESEDALRLARFSLDRAGDAVYWIDPQGRFVYANETACRMLGYSSDELSAMGMADIDPEVTPQNWPQTWAQIKERHAFTYEARHRAKSGTVIPVEVSIYHLAHGDRELVCGFVRDISERLQADTALQASKAEAERADQAKTRFLAAASHDLRQPLHAMELLVTVLSEKLPGAEVQSIISDIRESLSLTRRLLDSLLDISELEAGAVSSELRAVPLGPVLRRLQHQYGVIAGDQGLELRVVASTAVVLSDPGLLERILDNLVSNAVHHAGAGRVLLGCRRSGDRVRIEVWDTGPGIPADKLSAIFEDFCQLDASARDRGAGLGLGLGIVRRLVDLLDHRIEAVSTPGRGSSFRVEAERGTEPAAQEAGLAVEEPIAQPAASATILVIEDDAMVLQAMQHVLQAWGYRVVGVPALPQALEALSGKEGLPDLVIADYRLPGEATGIDAVAALSGRAGRKLPAVIVTGDIAAGSTRELSDSGLHVLKKPVRPAKLRALLRHLLEDRGAGGG
jgi:PAS domain S-box-containing protein